MSKILSLPGKAYREMRNIKKMRKESMRIQDIYYHDIIGLLSGGCKLHKNKTIILRTKFPLASESLDYLYPKGAIQDNTRCFAFYKRCAEIYGSEMAFLDLGCSGGGIVFDFALNGHLAIGLEGTDHSLKLSRAYWRTIPENLFTCDITKEFDLVRNDTDERQLFNVISMWEVFEHIDEDHLSGLFLNVRNHISNDGIFVGSISKNKNDPLHVTVKDNLWWSKKFDEEGFEVNMDYGDVLKWEHFCRGVKSGLYDSYDYKNNPDAGIHFVARRK